MGVATSSGDPREQYLIRYAGSFAPFVVERAEGSWVFTTDGRRVLDFTSGQISSTLGHNHPRVLEAIERSMRTAVHLNSWMLHEDVLELARRLAELLPDPLQRFQRAGPGPRAFEAAEPLEAVGQDRQLPGHPHQLIELLGIDPDP